MSRGKNFLFLSYFFEVKIWFVTRNAHPKTAPLTQIHTRGIREQHTHTYAAPPSNLTPQGGGSRRGGKGGHGTRAGYFFPFFKEGKRGVVWWEVGWSGVVIGIFVG